MKKFFLMCISLIPMSNIEAQEDNLNINNLEKCAMVDFINAQAGYSCLGNTGRIYTKKNSADFTTSDGIEWTAPKPGQCFDYLSAEASCKANNTTLPVIEDFKTLQSDFWNSVSNKMNPMFVSTHCCSHTWMWALTPFVNDSASLALLWNYKEGSSAGRYYADAKLNTSCIKGREAPQQYPNCRNVQAWQTFVVADGTWDISLSSDFIDGNCNPIATTNYLGVPGASPFIYGLAKRPQAERNFKFEMKAHKKQNMWTIGNEVKNCILTININEYKTQTVSVQNFEGAACAFNAKTETSFDTYIFK